MYQKEISSKNEKSQHPLCMQISPLKYKKRGQGNPISVSKLTKGQQAWSLSLVHSESWAAIEIFIGESWNCRMGAGRELKEGTENIHDMRDIPPKGKLGEGKGH